MISLFKPWLLVQVSRTSVAYGLGIEYFYCLLQLMGKVIQGEFLMSSKLLREYYAKDSRREWKRLASNAFHRLEFDTTMLFLKKYLPKKGLILDAGGGPGRYTIELARLGYDVVLLDLVPEMLQIAKRKIKKEKVQDRVKEIVEASIEDLSMYENDTFDSVLCLGGALCHLVNKKRRQKAVNELVRVAKGDAPIFVSVIGRLAVCTNSIVYLWPEMLEAPDVFRKYTTTGDYLGGWGFAPAHFYSIEELKEEFEHKAAILEMVGLEGIFSPHQRKYNQAYRQKKYNEILWETHLKTCTDPCIVGTSQHFMIIFRKWK
jgi:ubiquinone/menaquinone biosynthesis C-methylase UbiE